MEDLTCQGIEPDRRGESFVDHGDLRLVNAGVDLHVGDVGEVDDRLPLLHLGPLENQGLGSAAAPAGARREWTPVPLPKPSYLSAPVVPAGAVAPALDHAAALAAAAAEAERAQRAAALAAASVDRTAAPSTATDGEAPRVERPAASRFAGRGLVDGLPTRAPDLDEVLQRRRAAS